MYTFILIIHLIVCLFLIFIVLIQSSKGAEMGAAFGGSNQTLFGSRGAATVLTKVTTIGAVLFMLTSLTLAVISVRKDSVMSDAPVKQTSEQPIPDRAGGPLTAEPVAPGQGDAKAEPPAKTAE